MHKLTVPTSVNLDHYEAGSCVFGCLDDRFYPLIEECIESLQKEGGFDHVDRVIHAGGAKDLAEQGSFNQESLFDQLAKSRKLHDPHNTLFVAATTHEDCGACGEEAKCGGDRRKQFLYHLNLHRNVHAAIVERHPELEGRIRHFYLSINGVIELDLTHSDVNEEEMKALVLAA